MTIPARREALDCLDVAAAPARRAATLLVLVVNAGDEPEDRRGGEQLLAGVEARAPARWRGPGLSLHRLRLPEGIEVLLVDRCRPPRAFGPREGVGLARKLGADLILRLIDAGAIRSPWIHTSDADARLPAEHFERLAAAPVAARVVAGVAPFVHVPGGDPATDEATLRYELSLRYYVLGLRSAGSPYAFHTIGSLISVAAPAYAGVRGFPRRRAGEDFYMLNKLAKLGLVARLAGAPVRIRARRSTRAPFGTGPAVEALLAGDALRVYDPRVFGLLGRALRALDALAERGEPSPLRDLVRLEPTLQGWEAEALELAERYPATNLRRRLHEHFDGFRTLKLIHALSERWPKLAWSEALASARFLGLDPESPLERQRAQLIALERAG